MNDFALANVHRDSRIGLLPSHRIQVMRDRYLGRRDKLRRAVKKSGADAILVTNFTNVTYLTGFTGDDSYLLVRLDGDVILSDFRYTTQLEGECPGLEMQIRRHSITMPEWVAKNLKAARIRHLALEADSVSWSLLNEIDEKASGAEKIPTSGLVEKLREVKDKFEIRDIRASVTAAEKAFGVLRATLQPEKTERQIRDELEYQLRVFGAEDRGFPSIVATGPRTALPMRSQTKTCWGRAISSWSIGGHGATSIVAT